MHWNPQRTYLSCHALAGWNLVVDIPKPNNKIFDWILPSIDRYFAWRDQQNISFCFCNHRMVNPWFQLCQLPLALEWYRNRSRWSHHCYSHGLSNHSLYHSYCFYYRGCYSHKTIIFYMTINPKIVFYHLILLKIWKQSFLFQNNLSNNFNWIIYN